MRENKRPAGPSTSLRSGRDDNFCGKRKILYTNGNCHPDRSEAEWRDLLVFCSPADSEAQITGDFCGTAEAMPSSNALYLVGVGVRMT